MIFPTTPFVLGLLLCALFSQTPLTTPNQTRKPLIYKTPAQPITAYLKRPNQPDVALRGQAALTVTAAHLDDTLTGTFVFALSEEARKQLAELINRPLSAIPKLLAKREIKAVFQQETACPWLRLELNLERLEILDQQLHFKPVVLEVPEKRDYLGQLFCHWARQINVNRQRRGIIAAINRALHGEEAQ
jgi:hypothetical protein